MSLINHESAKEYVRGLLEHYGFLARTEAWTPDGVHRVDVLAECRRPELCDEHKVAVEVERTSNLAKDAESLNSTGADVKYIALLKPYQVPSTFGDIHVVQLEGFENSLRQVLGIDKREPSYPMFRLPRGQPAPQASLEEFRKTMQDMGLAGLVMKAEELLAKAYAVDEVPHGSCLSIGGGPGVPPAKIECEHFEDPEVVNLLKQLGYMSETRKGSYGRRVFILVHLTGKGEELASQVMASRIAYNGGRITELVSGSRGTAVLASIIGESIAWKRRYAGLFPPRAAPLEGGLCMIDFTDRGRGQLMPGLPNWLACFGRIASRLPRTSSEVGSFWAPLVGLIAYEHDHIDSRGRVGDRFVGVPYGLIELVAKESHVHDHLGELYDLAQRLIAWDFIAIMRAEVERGDLQGALSLRGLEHKSLQGAVDELYKAGITGRLLPASPYLVVLNRDELKGYVGSKLAELDEELVSWAKGMRCDKPNPSIKENLR